LKAVAEASAQMRADGSSEKNITIWAKAFDAALKPYLRQIRDYRGTK
jgi:hypothetical protein